MSYLGVSGGVSCATARTVERYWERHVILSKTVRIAGRRWTYLRFGSTGTQFTIGAPKVGVLCIEIESRPYG